MKVAETTAKVGGFRYVVGHSIDPDTAPYVGMAELHFPDRSAWKLYRETIQDAGMAQWISAEETLVLEAQTEFIAIP